MDIAQCDQPQLEELPHGLAAHLLADVPSNEIGQALLQLLYVRARTKQHIGQGVARLSPFLAGHGCDRFEVEMRVGGQVFDDGADMQRSRVTQLDGFADDIFTAEELTREAPRDHEHVGPRQRSVGVARQHLRRKHAEEVRVRAAEVRLNLDILVLHVKSVAGPQPGRGLHFGKIQPERGRESRVRDAKLYRAFDIHLHPEYALGVRICAVVGQLVAHEQPDQDGCSETQREPEDVDRGVGAIAEQAANRRDEIVVQHFSLTPHPRSRTGRRACERRDPRGPRAPRSA